MKNSQGCVLAEVRDDEHCKLVLATAHLRALELRVPLVVCRYQPSEHLVLPADPRPAIDALVSELQAITGRSREDVTLIQPSGTPSRSLGAIVERLDPGLVVTGPTLTAMILGRTLRCPLLVVRPSDQGTIVAATDFTDAELPALTAAITEARNRRTPLMFFHAAASGDPALADIERKLQQHAAAHGVTAETRAVFGEPVAELLRVAAAGPVEMLVLARRPEKNERGYLRPSFVDLAISALRCSVLVVPKEL